MNTQQEEARMRLENIDKMRRRTWSFLQYQVSKGRLTETEAANLKELFWADRAADQRIANGRYPQE